MKRSLPIFIVLLVNYLLASIAFAIFLNWYDSGKLDYSGTLEMGVGGLLFGILAVNLEFRLFQYQSIWRKVGILLFVRHTFLGVTGLMCSFVFSYIGKILDAKTVVEAISVLWIIFFATMFYSLLMFPFGVYLGIANGILLSLFQPSIKSGVMWD